MDVDYDSSINWIAHWRDRNLITSKCKHGEKQDQILMLLKIG